MLKNLLICALALALTLTLFTACGDEKPPVDGTEGQPIDTKEPAQSEAVISRHLLVDKYDPRVNGIYPVAGTFTDRLDADILTEAIMMAQTPDAAPMLCNLITLMGLTRDDIVLYSEMNGDLLLLESELIDGLFLEGEALREALRGDHTLMAGGIPYTVFELAAMSEADLNALNIPADELKAYLASIPAIAEQTGEQLPADVQAMSEAFAA